jgi:antitoxin component of MazEF toxin-antitoxin module
MRKLEQRNIRKITKIGKKSFAVTLPIEVVRAWHWKERQKVVLEADNKKKIIKIKDWRSRP